MARAAPLPGPAALKENGSPRAHRGARGSAPAVRAVGRPRDGDSGETRRLIVDAAIHVFGARGYEGASIVDIGRTVGVTPTTVYHHFESKSGLFLAACSELMKRIREAWMIDVDPTLDVRANFMRLVRASVRLGGENRPLSQFALTVIVDRLRDPLLDDGLGEIDSEMGRFVDGLISRAPRAGSVSSRINSERLVNVLNFILFGLTISHISLEEEQYGALADDLVSLLEGSLFVDDRRGRRR